MTSKIFNLLRISLLFIHKALQLWCCIDRNKWISYSLFWDRWLKDLIKIYISHFFLLQCYITTFSFNFDHGFILYLTLKWCLEVWKVDSSQLYLKICKAISSLKSHNFVKFYGDRKILISTRALTNEVQRETISLAFFRLEIGLKQW